MKGLIAIKDALHQREAASCLREGLNRHGIEVETLPFNSFGRCDFVAIWGWRQKLTIEAALDVGVPILVMERGHLQPRAKWISLGWGGLAGRGIYPGCCDGGERFETQFGHLMAPWKVKVGKTALVLGQISGDPSLRGMDPKAWAMERVTELTALGYERIIYRQHPSVREKGHTWRPKGAERSQATLAEDFDQAAIAISFSSTAGIEAVLSGTPHVAFDEGSMAWPVSAHRDASLVVRPRRKAWAHALAWTQWRADEIRSGMAWEALKACMTSLQNSSSSLSATAPRLEGFSNAETTLTCSKSSTC